MEIEPSACQTLRLNRPDWNVIEGDVRLFQGEGYDGIDLLAAAC
ncbi:DNA (cytosine-5-)-methyltransferase, partial [Neisseria gonorrhoeae]